MTDEHYEELLRFYKQHRGENVLSREYIDACKKAGLDIDEIYDNQMTLDIDSEFE